MRPGNLPLRGGTGIVHYRALQIAKAARPKGRVESSCPERRARARLRAAERQAQRERENLKHAERVRVARERENRERYPDFFRMTGRADFRAWWEEATGDKWSEKDEAIPQDTIGRIHEILQWEREREEFERQIAADREQIAKGWAKWAAMERAARLAEFANILQRHGRQGRPTQWRALMMTLATPAWVDRAAIREVYRRSQEMGPDVVVDHIVPILGKTVCGLHVAANLRIIDRDENARKSNRWPKGGVDADPETGRLNIS